MEEQRKLKRKRLIYYLNLVDRDTDPFVGQLVDITSRGMMLTSETPIEEGNHFRLKLILPEEINGSSSITFDAESIWCQKDINPNFYLIGFKFIQITQEAGDIIQSLIYEFSFTS